MIAVWLVIESDSLAQSTKLAERAFETGRALMAKKSYAEACAAFEVSQRLDPQYGTQFNLAGCYVALDKLATAWKLYRELASSDRNAARQLRAGELAAELAARVPKLRIHIDGRFSGARVLVSETDVTALVNDEIPLDAGHYVVAASLVGFLPFRREIDIATGLEVRELEIVLTPEPVRPQEQTTRMRSAKIAFVGGGALVAGGLVATWRVFVNRDKSRDQCNFQNCPDRLGSQASVERARLWGDGATTAMVLGAAGLAGGLYLWHTSHPQSVHVGATLEPASASLVLYGGF
jgi:tetratricopeptide (TPR) repeat protein